MERTKRGSFKWPVLIIFLLLLGWALYYANDGFQNKVTEQHSVIETARVVAILENQTEVNSDGILLGSMELQLEILTGHYQGQLVESTYFLNQLFSSSVEVGDRLSVLISFLDGNIQQVQIQNPERREVVIGFFAVFLLLLGLVGGKRGLMAIAGLIFTLVSIIFLLIPLMLKGYPVLLTTLIILSLVTVVTLILLGGVTPKTISAILGCLMGVFIAAILAHVVGNLAHISGLNMEDVGMILARTDFPVNQAQGLFISGVLIASLGAVMDTAVSVSSAMEEIKASNPKITPGRLFRSGMNVGRDTMGTMSNTLILAFAGTSLNMIIFIYSQDISFNQIVNDDFIVIELIRSLAGSLGIVLTVPAVAFVGALMMSGSPEK